MESEAASLEKELLQGLREVVAAFNHFQIRYALIGGIAVGFRSRPRATSDLDFLLDVPQLVLPGLLEELGKRDFKFDLQKTIWEWTQHHLTVLRYGVVRIDLLKPVLPAYRHVLETSRFETLVDHSVSVASAEGLILTKLMAFRPQDKADIISLLAANRDQLNLNWVREEWKPLAEENDARSREFEAMVNSLKSDQNQKQGG